MESNSTQTVSFVKMQNASGRYAIFQVPGHRERIYIDTKLFPNGVTPASIQVSDMVPPGAEIVIGDSAKAAAKAAKAVEKAEAANVKIETFAKINEAIAQAEAALACAAKLTAAVTPARTLSERKSA